MLNRVGSKQHQTVGVGNDVGKLATVVVGLK